MTTDKFKVGDVVFVGGVHRVNGKRRKATVVRVRRDSAHAYEVRFEDSGKVEVAWDNPNVAKLWGPIDGPKNRVLARTEN